MNKRDLVTKTVDLLRENDVRKYITTQRTVFHISDDHGNNSDFVIKKSGRGLLFTIDDVNSIVDACLAVIEESIKHGETISIHGFGTLEVKHRAARQTRHPETGEPISIEPRYTPKFSSGNILKRAARIYEMSLNEERGDE